MATSFPLRSAVPTLEIRKLARELETTTLHCWIPETVQQFGGWRLRFCQGVTRRANSVWPNGPCPGTLSEAVARVERQYRAAGLPPCFQLTPAAKPPDLDRFLADRGYRTLTPSLVQSAPLTEILHDERTDLDPSPAGPWVDAFRSIHPEGARRGSILSGIIRRAGRRAFGCQIDLEGSPAAVGLGITYRGWLGVFCMATAPEHRGRGLASSILRALCDEGMRRGATRAFLQVEAANLPARRLYEKAGFATRYEYHYREIASTKS